MSAPLDKADAIAFRILGLDERAALRSGLDFRDADAMVAEVIAHASDTAGRKGDFLEPGTGIARMGRNEFDVLALIDHEAGILYVGAAVFTFGGARWKAQNFGIGLGRLREIGGF